MDQAHILRDSATVERLRDAKACLERFRELKRQALASRGTPYGELVLIENNIEQTLALIKRLEGRERREARCA